MGALLILRGQTPCKRQHQTQRSGTRWLAADCRVHDLLLNRNRMAIQSRGIFPERYVADAQHVAIAVVHGLDYLCSWNFTHLVRVATRREVNLVSSLMGYGQVEIIAPPEL